MSVVLNLLPPELKAEAKRRERLGRLLSWSLWVAVSLGAVLVALILGNVWLTIVRSGQSRTISQTEESLSRFYELEQNVRTIAERVEGLKSQDNERVLWSKVVEELANVTPGSIRISSVALRHKSDIQVKITGFGTTKSEVALFRDRLEGSPFFTAVSVESVGTATLERRILTSFSIIGSLEATR